VAGSFAQFVAAANSAMIAVTASAHGRIDAALVGFHSQSSIDPPEYVVWLSKMNLTTRLARDCAVLAVHLLSAEQHDLAVQLGSVTEDDDPDKMRKLRTRRHSTGAMLLAECPAWFVGRIQRKLPGGDHQGFVLAPIAASRTTVSPLRLDAVTDIQAGHPDD